MKKIIHCCSKCGAEVITSGNEKARYRSVEFRIGQFDSDYLDSYSGYSSNSFSLNKMYLCPNCYKPLGISDELMHEKNCVKGDYNPVSDRLYEIFLEIIEESKNN